MIVVGYGTLTDDAGYANERYYDHGHVTVDAVEW